MSAQLPVDLSGAFARANLERFGVDLGRTYACRAAEPHMEFLNLWKDAAGGADRQWWPAGRNSRRGGCRASPSVKTPNGR